MMPSRVTRSRSEGVTSSTSGAGALPLARAGRVALSGWGQVPVILPVTLEDRPAALTNGQAPWSPRSPSGTPPGNG